MVRKTVATTTGESLSVLQIKNGNNGERKVKFSVMDRGSVS
jgi:hypothetical protein